MPLRPYGSKVLQKNPSPSLGSFRCKLKCCVPPAYFGSIPLTHNWNISVNDHFLFMPALYTVSSPCDVTAPKVRGFLTIYMEPVGGNVIMGYLKFMKITLLSNKVYYKVSYISIYYLQFLWNKVKTIGAHCAYDIIAAPF